MRRILYYLDPMTWMDWVYRQGVKHRVRKGTATKAEMDLYGSGWVK